MRRRQALEVEGGGCSEWALMITISRHVPVHCCVLWLRHQKLGLLGCPEWASGRKWSAPTFKPSGWRRRCLRQVEQFT